MNTSGTHPSSLILAGACLLLFAASLLSTAAWLSCRSELKAAQVEIQLSELALRDTRQQLAAHKLINQRQLEMLRQGQR